MSLVVAGVAILVARSGSADWAFLPSAYTHDPASGKRVDQYAQPAPSYSRAGENYLQSGYRHNRSSIWSPYGSDNLHIVETWGDGEFIRPYGEWLRPFREGATPYGPWGNPQGPWTLPFDSWVNPYGLLQHMPYGPYGPYRPGPFKQPFPHTFGPGGGIPMPPTPGTGVPTPTLPGTGAMTPPTPGTGMPFPTMPWPSPHMHHPGSMGMGYPWHGFGAPTSPYWDEHAY